MSGDLSWVQECVEAALEVTGDCLLVGGSSARGWANPSSDIDAYVLGGPEDRGDRIEADPGAGHPAIDIHTMSAVAVDALFAKVAWEMAPDGDYVNQISEKEWLLLERLHHAQVLRGQDAFEAYRKRLEESAHRHMLIQTHFAKADDFAEDCLGQLQIDDLDSAAISGRAAYLRTVDGMLAANGCFSWSYKWRARAMQEAQPELMPYSDFWRLLTMADLATDGQRRFALRCVAAARELMSRVDVLQFAEGGPA